MGGLSLKPFKKSDLIIIRANKDDVFINRFNLLISEFFFPLLIPIRKKPFLI